MRKRRYKHVGQGVGGGYKAAPIAVRSWEKINIGADDECWPWAAKPNQHGYGMFFLKKVKGKSCRIMAHRLAYELVKGPIPDGLQIDHLCRNRACSNPAHLEAVTQKVNILRGEGWAAKWARRTHCEKGHEFTYENIFVPLSGTGRMCIACSRERQGPRT